MKLSHQQRILLLLLILHLFPFSKGAATSEDICLADVSLEELVKNCFYEAGDVPEIIEFRRRECEGGHCVCIWTKGCKSVEECQEQYARRHCTETRRIPPEEEEKEADGDEIGTAVGESIPTPSPRARRANDTFPGKGCLEAAAAIKRLEALLDSFPPSCPPPEDRTLFEAAIADSLRNVLQIGREVADAVIRVERRIGDYNLETRRAFVGLRRNLTGEVKTADIRARSRSADLESGLREELDQVHGKMDLLKPPSPASYRSEGEGGERVEDSAADPEPCPEYSRTARVVIGTLIASVTSFSALACGVSVLLWREKRRLRRTRNILDMTDETSSASRPGDSVRSSVTDERTPPVSGGTPRGVGGVTPQAAVRRRSEIAAGASVDTARAVICREQGRQLDDGIEYAPLEREESRREDERLAASSSEASAGFFAEWYNYLFPPRK